MNHRPLRSLGALALGSLTLAACDAAEPAAPLPPRSTAFRVEYHLTGTYARCRVDYVGADGLRASEDVALPWSKGFRLTMRTGDAPFAAGFTSTCADAAREGKSTAALLVDGAVRDQRANAGAGAATVVSATLRPLDR